MLRILAVLLLFGLARASDKPPNVLSPEIQHVLDSADSAILYSLDPNAAPGNKFHYFRILGKTKLNRDETREAAHAFDKAIAGFGDEMANCFNARHGLRIVSAGHIYDYLLCYECDQVEVFIDDKLVADLGAAGSPNVLNHLLREHHLPIAGN